MSFLAWPLTLIALVFMFPWARWLLKREPNPALLALTTLALSVGMLSLVMLWIGLLGFRIEWRTAAFVCALMSASGFFVLNRARAETTAVPPDPSIRAWRALANAALIITGIIAGLITFNAVYWPLSGNDAIAIYGWFGKTIAQSGELPRGALYETYPMLLPLSYAFTHQAAGWIDEHLAALIPALLSVGVIGVAYLLGCELVNRAVGITAALLIALTPTITYWSSASYADLPAGFFYGLATLFLLRHYRRRAWQDALLAGIMAGLAAWTKNSALLIVLSIGAWIVYCEWRTRRELPRPLSMAHIALIAGGFLTVCAPWYAHNLVIAGLLVPPTGWTWKAERTLSNLFPYLIDRRYFLSGWVFTAGLGWSLFEAWQSRGRSLAPLLLAIFYLPFFILWWALFSYDPRFLLILTPIIAVMGACAVQSLARRFPPPLLSNPRLNAALIGLLALLALPAASDAVAFKLELLRHPLMSDAEKHHVRYGSLYDMAQYLNTLPPGSRVWTEEQQLPYFADSVQVTVGPPPTADQLESYQYWVSSPGDRLPDGFDSLDPVHTEGAYRLYAINYRFRAARSESLAAAHETDAQHHGKWSGLP